MRGIVKVVIGGLVVLAIVVVAALVLNIFLTRGGPKGGASSPGTTYTFGTLGFAVTYDSKLLKVEIDKSLQLPRTADVHFVSRLGSQNGQDLPTNPNQVEVIVRPWPPPYPKVTLAETLKQWLAAEALGPGSKEQYHLTTLNGLRGVVLTVANEGGHLVVYQLYTGHHHVTVEAWASISSPAQHAITSLIQSIRATS